MTFEEQLEKSGKLVYTNCGVSMMPLLRESRDLMLIESIKAPICKYDAVLFIRPEYTGRGRYILHRVMKCNSDGTYYIIGDNCETGEIVKRENIIGILTGVLRNGKLISVDSRKYHIYVKLVWLLFPVRFIYKKCRRLAGKIYRRLFKRS